MAIVEAHALLYSTEPDALRATLRDVFGWSHVDAGGGWLIFALPPAEIAVHPADESTEHATSCRSCATTSTQQSANCARRDSR